MIQFLFHYILHFVLFCDIFIWELFLFQHQCQSVVLTLQDCMAADVLAYNKQIIWITTLALLCWFLVLESEHFSKILLWFSTKSIETTCRFETTWWWVNDEHWENIVFNSCFNLNLSCTYKQLTDCSLYSICVCRLWWYHPVYVKDSRISDWGSCPVHWLFLAN